MPGSGVGVGAFIFDEHGRAAVRNLDFRMQVECTKHRFQSCWSQIDLWLVTRFNFQWCGTCTLLSSAVFWDFPLSSRLAFVSQGSSFRDSQRMVCIFASFFFLQRSSSCEMMLSPLFSDDSNKVLLLKRSSSARTAPGTWARPPFQQHLFVFSNILSCWETSIDFPKKTKSQKMSHVTDLSHLSVLNIGWCWWPHGRSWYNFSVGDHALPRRPGGAVNFGESCEAALAREIRQDWGFSIGRLQVQHEKIWNMCNDVKGCDTYRCEIIDFVLSGKKLAWKSVRLNCWMHQPYISTACFCSYKELHLFLWATEDVTVSLHLFFSNFANLPAPEFDGPNTYQIYHFMTFECSLIQGHIGTIGWEPLGVDRPGHQLFDRFEACQIYDDTWQHRYSMWFYIA